MFEHRLTALEIYYDGHLKLYQKSLFSSTSLDFIFIINWMGLDKMQASENSPQYQFTFKEQILTNIKGNTEAKFYIFINFVVSSYEKTKTFQDSED
jgi:hypothetical protein